MTLNSVELTGSTLRFLGGPPGFSPSVVVSKIWGEKKRIVGDDSSLDEFVIKFLFRSLDRTRYSYVIGILITLKTITTVRGVHRVEFNERENCNSRWRVSL